MNKPFVASMMGLDFDQGTMNKNSGLVDKLGAC